MCFSTKGKIMIKLRFLCYVIIFWIANVNVLTASSHSSIVLVFDHIPPYVKRFSPCQGIDCIDDRAQISIFDNFYQFDFNPKSSISDTIVFYPQNEHVILNFIYFAFREPLTYVITEGDTITFSFIGGIPYASNKNASKNDYLNYERERLIANKAPQQKTMYEIYRNPILIVHGMEDVNKLSEIQKRYYASARNFLNNEILFLDSCMWLKTMSACTYNFFRDKFTYQLADIDFQQNRLRADSLNVILKLNKQKKISTSYSYFLPLLEDVARDSIFKKAKILKYKNGNDIDYRDIYDKTSNWTAINDFYRKLLLFEYLKQIGETFSTTDLGKYLSKFISFSDDTSLIRKIKNEFLIFDTLNNGDSLYLRDAKNTKKSLHEILSANKGKVIYIDFWASWCIPCREEMRYAEKLRNTFKNKNIVYIYLSIDKSKSAWIKASIEENLNKTQNNYIVTNTDSSKFMKSIKLESIPRYLIYDRYGTLVYKDAPSPSSKALPDILMSYIE